MARQTQIVVHTSPQTAKQEEDENGRAVPAPATSAPPKVSVPLVDEIEDDEQPTTLAQPLRLGLRPSKPTQNLFSSMSTPSTPSVSNRTAAPTLVCYPQPSRRFFPPYAGLTNFGSTCYVNSCIQALFFAPVFREAVATMSNTLDTFSPTSMQRLPASFESSVLFINALADLLRYMQEKRDAVGDRRLETWLPSIRPTQFLNAASAMDPRYGTHSAQQDVQEFFAFVMASLEDGIKVARELVAKGVLVSMVQDEPLDPRLFEDIFSSIPKSPSTQNAPSLAIQESLSKEVSVNDFSQLGDARKKRPLDTSSSTRSSAFSAPQSAQEIPAGSFTFSSSTDRASPTEAPAAKRPKLFTSSSDDNGSSPSHQPMSDTIPISIQPRPARPTTLTLLDNADLSGDLALSYDTSSSHASDEPKSGAISPVVDDNSANAMDVDQEKPTTAMAVDEGSAKSAKPPAPVQPTLPLILEPQNLFRGEVTSTRKCCECERESGRPEPFYDISLAIEPGKDLIWSLTEYLGTHSLLSGANKYDCEECRLHTEAFSYHRISKLPNVLTLHLKRFAWGDSFRAESPYSFRSRNTANGSKLNFHVACPDYLDIPAKWLSTDLQKEFFKQSAFFSSSADGLPAPPVDPDASHHTTMSPSRDMAPQAVLEPDLRASLTSSNGLKQSAARVRSLLNSDLSLARYRLFAIIYHSGLTTTFGHYTAAVRLPTQKSTSPRSPVPPLSPSASPSGSPQWAHFDDNHVSPLTHEEALRSVSANATGSHTAYIVLYERLPNA